MTTANEEQKKYWSGKGGDIWVKRQESMDNMLFPLGEVALKKLNLKNSSIVLDIGCGCGSTTLKIAKKVMPRGKVTGIDISKAMLHRAKELALKNFLTNTKFLTLDVQTDNLPEKTFTEAYSRFGVMFFEDPVQAFKNIYKSLGLGGKFSFVCWRSPKLNPWHSLSVNAIRKYLDLPIPLPKNPGPFAFQEENYLREILKESDFKEVEIETLERKIILFKGRSLKDSAKDYLSINPVITEMLKKASDNVIGSVTNSLIDAFEPFYSSEGLIFPSTSWIVTAKKTEEYVG